MKYLPTLIFIALLFACQPKSVVKQSLYFEGILESKVGIQAPNEQTENMLAKYYGDKIITYIKGSYVSRVYYNKQDIIIRREIFNHDSVKLYTYNSTSDTLWYTNLSNGSYYKFANLKEVQPKKILGSLCKGVSFNDELYSANTDTPFVTFMQYYFDTAYRLPDSIYKGARYANLDELFSHYPYVTMEVQIYDPALQATIFVTATRIIKAQVDNSVFTIPNNKILVRTN